MSTPRRVTRQASTSNAGPSSSPAKGKIIVINDSTPTRPAKRARTTPSISRRTSARLAAGSATPQKSSPLKKAIGGRRSGVAVVRDNDTDDEDDSSGSEASSLGGGLISTLAKGAGTATGQGFVHRNAFDAYFAAASKPSRTSNNVFSELVPPLSMDEFTTLLANSEAASKHAAELEQVLKGHENLFPRYAFELAEGFNLLFFGFGSKRAVLNNFARSVCVKRGHVVLVNGYMPGVGIKEVITSIEGVPGLADVPFPPSTTGLEAQTRRIYEFFLPPGVRPQHSTSERPLFLFIHNIDSPLLRAPKAKATLSLLALNPRIHVVASIDHINAQTIWSTADASTRKHSYGEESLSHVFNILPTRGFAWVWHDMTTMQPYAAELAHVDMNSIRKKRGKAVGSTERDMSESAAQHILASVNVKAKKLFMLLANMLLTSFGDDGARSKQKMEKQLQNQLQHHAVPYETLFNAARTDFIATNDTSLKALLTEFRDHGLVLTLTSGGGESMWIPLRVDELRRIVASLAGE